MPENRWVDARPFALGPSDARTAFVLVHGFTGAPAEMRPLGERLADAGHRVIGVQLPGHGTDESSLDGVTRHDWLDAVRDAIDWAAESAERIVLAGLSMGGLLTTVIAARDPRVDVAILLAPAFEVDNPLMPLVGFGRLLIDTFPAPDQPRAGLTSEDGWKRLFHYDRRPLDAVWELRKLQKMARRSLSELRVPVLVMQGRRDETLRLEGAQRAFDALPGASNELIWLDESGHCLTVDVELDRVVDEIVRFVSASTR